MLKEFFSKKGIKKLIDRVRIGGMTVNAHLTKNRTNTKAMFDGLFTRMVMGEATLDQAVEEVNKVAKTRKRQTLTTIKNVMHSVRGQARAITVGGQAGTWYNVGTLDGVQTHVCFGYMGDSWDIPYSQILDKPPRVSVTPHPCRSFLVFRKRGDNTLPPEPPFMEQFNASEDLQRELLGKKKFEAYKRGEFKIRSPAEYEKRKLTSVKELGLDQ